MERILKWTLPALVVVEAALVGTGRLDVGTAVGVVVGIEVLLALVAGRQIVVAVRRYRQNRAAGVDLWQAVEDGLTVLLPSPVARVVAMEPLLWLCLWQWLFRRRSPGSEEFAYHRRSIVGSLLVVVVVTTPVELLLFEMIVPWAWLRWLLIVGAIYMLIWAFAFHASLLVLPHRLEASAIRVRYGALTRGQIPYAQIAEVEHKRRRAPKGNDGFQLAADENAGYLTVGGRTDVTLRLRAPVALEGVLGPTVPVSTLHLAADDPAQLAHAIGRRIGPGLMSSEGTVSHGRSGAYPGCGRDRDGRAVGGHPGRPGASA
ncbi:MAG: hypothetical protein HY331_01250 [Chloroflexi bacterium]|nr:hypothetical protein [Chloroflexota bacterium]